MKLATEQDLINYGRELGVKLAQAVKLSENTRAQVVELTGDVGAGKTTLTRGLAEGLGVTEMVTSPSFTISKRYAFPGGELVHYDFYRLPDPGIMRDEIAETLSDPSVVVVVEWGDSVADLLPEGHIRIDISLSEDGGREINNRGDCG